MNEQSERDAKRIRYADDFVIACRPGEAESILERLKKYLRARKLTLNEEKTRVVDSRREKFRFLGIEFSRRRSSRTSNDSRHVEPSAKAQEAHKQAVRETLNHWTQWRRCAEVAREINHKSRGWANDYDYGHTTRVYGKRQGWLEKRLRLWLWRKQGCTHGKYSFITKERLLGQYKLWEKPLKAAWSR